MKNDLVINGTRGIMAGLEYYSFMCRYKTLAKLITPTSELIKTDNNRKKWSHMDITERVQREVSPTRIPKISSYILTNKDNYVFSSLTASIDGEVEFIPISEEYYTIGKIHIPADATIILNDGQHRYHGICDALAKDPSIGEETIVVELHIDLGLQRARQIFTDINKNAMKPSSSLNLYFDSRDKNVTKELIPKIKFFNGRIDYEKNKIGKSSPNLFGFNALNDASNEVLKNFKGEYKEKVNLLINYWNQVIKNMPDWTLIANKDIEAKDIREKTISLQSITLKALGIVGKYAIQHKNCNELLEGLKHIDFTRTNPTWEGRACQGGKVMGTKAHITLTADYLLQRLGIEKKNIEVVVKKVEPKVKEKAIEPKVKEKAIEPTQKIEKVEKVIEPKNTKKSSTKTTKKSQKAGVNKW